MSEQDKAEPEGESHADGPAVSDNFKQLTSRQLLSQSVEEMISDMNAKRRRDTTLLEELKKDLDSQCSSAYQAMEGMLYHMYSKSSKNIDNKLQELFATLERIDKLESEMEQFRQQLGMLCTDVQS